MKMVLYRVNARITFTPRYLPTLTIPSSDIDETKAIGLGIMALIKNL